MQSLCYSMTQRVARASARIPAGSISSLQCFACGCTDGMCYVAMKRKSVQKMSREGRCIKCPVHQDPRHSSTYALKFHTIIQRLSLTKHSVHGIVWDWFDVPDSDASNHKMHIDATVFYSDTCMRFEVDGETHFSDNCTSRLLTDERKDDVLCACGVGMLRLHYMDCEQWERYILHAVNSGYTAVRYTASYRHCLHPEEYQHIVDI